MYLCTSASRMDVLLEFVQTSPWAIWGLFALLILCGMGLPMPEDIILIATGVLAAVQESSWVYASVLMYCGVIAGDSLMFMIGRRYGSRLLAARWTRRWLSQEKQQRVTRLLDRFGSTAFFVARFMPGLRAPFFCTAGAMGARYSQFLLFDGLAALVSVPVFVWLGSFLWRKFGEDIEAFSNAMSRTHSYTLAFAVAVVVTIAIVIWCNRRKLAQVSRG